MGDKRNITVLLGRWLIFMLAIGCCSPAQAVENSSSRLKYIVEYAPENLYNNKEETYRLIKQGISLAKELNKAEELSLLFNQAGIYHYLNAEYAQSVHMVDSAIAINKEHQLYSNLVDNYNNKGYVFKVVGNYSTALENFHLAANLVDSLKLKDKQALTSTNIGKIHKLLDNNFSAIEYLNQAIRAAQHNQQHLVLANAYHNLGEVYLQMNELANSAHYFNEVITLADSADLPLDPTNTYGSLAQVLRRQGRIDQALFYHQKVYDLTKEKGYVVGVIQSLLSMGKCYLAKGELKKAKDYLVEGIYEATASERLDVIDDAYFSLANLHERKGNLDKALYFTRLGAGLQDSLNNAEKNRQIVEMQMLYEMDKQKREMENMALLNQTNEAKLETKTLAIVFMSVIIILLILLSILYGHYGRMKAQSSKMLENVVAARTHELARKEKILSAQNKKLMTYAHMTSHTLRKPLANILAIVNLVETKVGEEENKEEMFDLIKESAIEMDETVIQSMEVLSEKFELEEDPPDIQQQLGPAA